MEFSSSDKTHHDCFTAVPVHFIIEISVFPYIAGKSTKELIESPLLHNTGLVA
jgi:hypothetical protein